MEWVAKVGTAGHFQFPSSPDQERKWCQLSMQMLMLIVGWRKFQTCVPAQSCSTEMSSVEIGWIWISTTMLMMIRRILTMHYNCLGHARAFQKAFGKKIVFAFLARNQLIRLSLNPPSPPPSLTTLSIRAEFLGQRGSWPRFLKPVTSSQKKLPKTLNPPTLSTIQTTKKSLKSEDAKKKTKTGGGGSYVLWILDVSVVKYDFSPSNIP